jgi:microcystin-dependent protein
MDPILGQIILWPIPWVPVGWALCDGTTLQINQYQALYSLLGTKYGGDGVSTFKLPDLRGLVPLGTQNASLVGQTSGNATSTASVLSAGNVNIGVNNLPAHTHTASFTPGGSGASVNISIPVVSSGSASATATATPSAGASLGQVFGGAAPPKVYNTAAPDAALKPFPVEVPAGGGTVNVGNTGAGAPLPVSLTGSATVDTHQPALSLNFIIAVEGMYPSRP